MSPVVAIVSGAIISVSRTLWFMPAHAAQRATARAMIEGDHPFFEAEISPMISSEISPMVTPTEEAQHGNPFFGGVETTMVPHGSSADPPGGATTPPREVWHATFPDQRI